MSGQGPDIGTSFYYSRFFSFDKGVESCGSSWALDLTNSRLVRSVPRFWTDSWYLSDPKPHSDRQVHEFWWPLCLFWTRIIIGWRWAKGLWPGQSALSHPCSVRVPLRQTTLIGAVRLVVSKSGTYVARYWAFSWWVCPGSCQSAWPCWSWWYARQTSGWNLTSVAPSPAHETSGL